MIREERPAWRRTRLMECRDAVAPGDRAPTTPYRSQAAATVRKEPLIPFRRASGNEAAAANENARDPLAHLCTE
jgi:hypothetical protein